MVRNRLGKLWKINSECTLRIAKYTKLQDNKKMKNPTYTVSRAHRRPEMLGLWDGPAWRGVPCLTIAIFGRKEAGIARSRGSSWPMTSMGSSVCFRYVTTMCVASGPGFRIRFTKTAVWNFSSNQNTKADILTSSSTAVVLCWRHT